MMDVIQKLALELKALMDQKAVGTAQSATPLHGPNGIFSVCGTDRDVVTAHVRPMGINGVLRLIPSVETNPLFASLTGYTAVSGTQPTNACDSAPTGYEKSCYLTAAFGLKRFDTQTIEMDKVMLKRNRGDFNDLILHGEVLGMQGFSPSGLDQSQILNILTMSEMVGAGVQMERALNIDMWTGTVAAGSFPGLDAQIATGQVDALTNTTCPALDSDVKDFTYNDVCGSGKDIVEHLSMLEFYLHWNAEAMGLMPVRWVIVMRPQLWYELSACWPCRYNTYRCSTIDTSNIDTVPNLDAASMTAFRDDMRRRSVIPINGTEYPVIVDTGIYEYNNINNGNLAAGEYASSIYMVPIDIRGGFPVTYREYLDYRGAMPDRALLNGKEDWFWTDNGMYSWAIDQQLWCYQLALKTEQRVILRTPQLAGKIQHVKYSPLQHLREPDPDSPYFADGGVSFRSESTLYHVWT